jgi:TM2 domain-containing membrane protein YozV
MTKICPHCGKESVEADPRFCSGCGARMDGTLQPGFPGTAVPPGPQKSTTIAGFCSSFLPGLGQVYNGETAKGFVFFFLAVAGLLIFILPGLIVWLWAMYDAYAVAGRMNTGAIEFRETNTLHMVTFISVAVVVIVIAILLIIAAVIAGLSAGLAPISSPGMASYNRMFKIGGLF